VPDRSAPKFERFPVSELVCTRAVPDAHASGLTSLGVGGLSNGPCGHYYSPHSRHPSQRPAFTGYRTSSSAGLGLPSRARSTRLVIVHRYCNPTSRVIERFSGRAPARHGEILVLRKVLETSLRESFSKHNNTSSLPPALASFAFGHRANNRGAMATQMAEQLNTCNAVKSHELVLQRRKLRTTRDPCLANRCETHQLFLTAATVPFRSSRTPENSMQFFVVAVRQDLHFTAPAFRKTVETRNARAEAP